MKTLGSRSRVVRPRRAVDGVQGAAPDRGLQPDRHQVGCHRQRQRAQGHGRQRVGSLAGAAGEAVDQERRDRRRHQHSRKTPAARVGRVDGERGDHRHAGAAGRVEEEVVGGGHDREHDQRRVEGPEHTQHPRADEQDGGGADDQGVRGVQARHRGVGIGQRGDQAGVVIDGRLVQRVHEAQRAQHPRRCGRVERVAGQADRIGGDEHVAHQRERVVAPQVDPEQEPEADRELAVEVRPVGDCLHEVRRRGREVLDVELVEDPQRALGRDDVVGVAKRDRAVADGQRARRLVEQVEQREDRQLAGQVAPATGQPGTDAVDDRADRALGWCCEDHARSVSPAASPIDTVCQKDWCGYPPGTFG